MLAELLVYAMGPPDLERRGTPPVLVQAVLLSILQLRHFFSMGREQAQELGVSALQRPVDTGALHVEVTVVEQIST